MIDYRAGTWGFLVAFGWKGSLAPRAFAMSIPNAAITFFFSTMLLEPDFQSEIGGTTQDEMDRLADSAGKVITAFTAVMMFILYNRSRTSYNRWWEGGTLLQKTRGEWFNAYSSIMAFTSTKPELLDEVNKYTHMLARLMSLLMCCGLQQVSPYRDRAFEIIDLEGLEPESMEFLNSAPDKVEIILQWIQRSMVLHVATGVLPVAPPILSRAFQEVSRGIVNLQNARKIADFPYPYPLAQVCMVLQLIHWATLPIGAALAMPRIWACVFSFTTIWVLWCIHFNALDLEFPFGERVNDLPMHEMQQEWNKSLCTLLDEVATRPPKFKYNPPVHDQLNIVMSDASALYVPINPVMAKGLAVIKVSDKKDPEKVASRHSIAARKAGTASVHSDPLSSQATAPLSFVPATNLGAKREEKRREDFLATDVLPPLGLVPAPIYVGGNSNSQAAPPDDGRMPTMVATPSGLTGQAARQAHAAQMAHLESLRAEPPPLQFSSIILEPAVPTYTQPAPPLQAPAAAPSYAGGNPNPQADERPAPAPGNQPGDPGRTGSPDQQAGGNGASYSASVPGAPPEASATADQSTNSSASNPGQSQSDHDRVEGTLSGRWGQQMPPPNRQRSSKGRAGQTDQMDLLD